MQMPNPAEESLVKKFNKTIWLKFLKGIKEYQLIQAGDKIAVCISGGKDSMLMAKCMQRIQRYSKIPFEVIFLVMNPGYNEKNRLKIQETAKLLDIPIQTFDARIFDYVVTVDQNPCYLCARMRRGHLYKTAQDLGCNKIALGHHFDDVIETILMGMLYGSQIQTMMPKIHSENFKGMELIRPLYLVRESDIIAWKDYHHLEFIQCACRFTEHYEIDQNGGNSSKRQEIKELLQQLRKISPAIDKNIFRSVENVNLKTIISYHIGDEYHHFLDTYDQAITNHGTKSGEGR
ncbi:MAG: tRNA 2-thiocytidine biosynthesis protein TtcA [Oscillospiraceae bacterium]|nr:tRNA 2-thiocytidine biosynthesis protein TtcA [Oscillospiraceae bacterium]